MSNIKIDSQIKIDAYRVLSDAVEIGIVFGLQSAYKYQNTPDTETIKEEIHRSVMNSLCDILQIED